MEDSLTQMLEHQRELQLSMPPLGRDPSKLTGEDRVMFLKDMSLATLDEIHEMLDEIGWKPWATSRHVNEQRAREEMIDEWHFFMNRWLCLGGTAEMLTQMYFKKAQKNLERQQEGYDGVSSKCAFCHTELSELVSRYTIVSHNVRIERTPGTHYETLRFCNIDHHDEYFDTNNPRDT